jgi:hypothetical protein
MRQSFFDHANRSARVSLCNLFWERVLEEQEAANRSHRTALVLAQRCKIDAAFAIVKAVPDNCPVPGGSL